MTPEQVVDALDCCDAETAWSAFAQQLGIREQRERGIARELRDTAEACLIDAADHEARAAEFAQLVAAIERASVTFPASAIEAGTAETAQTGSVHEGAVPVGETPND